MSNMRKIASASIALALCIPASLAAVGCSCSSSAGNGDATTAEVDYPTGDEFRKTALDFELADQQSKLWTAKLSDLFDLSVGDSAATVLVQPMEDSTNIYSAPDADGGTEASSDESAAEEADGESAEGEETSDDVPGEPERLESASISEALAEDIAASSSAIVSLGADEGQITILAVNEGSSPRKLGECPVCEISISDGAKLPDCMKAPSYGKHGMGSSSDDILAELGVPDCEEYGDDGIPVSLTFNADGGSAVFGFAKSDKKVSSMTLSSAWTPAEGKAETDLDAAFYDGLRAAGKKDVRELVGNVEVEGVKIELGKTRYSDLTSQGFEAESSSADEVISGTETFILARNGKRYIFAFDGGDGDGRKLADCKVVSAGFSREIGEDGSVIDDADYDMSVAGFTSKDTAEKLAETLGRPSERYANRFSYWSESAKVDANFGKDGASAFSMSAELTS